MIKVLCAVMLFASAAGFAYRWLRKTAYPGWELGTPILADRHSLQRSDDSDTTRDVVNTANPVSPLY